MSDGSEVATPFLFFIFVTLDEVQLLLEIIDLIADHSSVERGVTRVVTRGPGALRGSLKIRYVFLAMSFQLAALAGRAHDPIDI